MLHRVRARDGIKGASRETRAIAFKDVATIREKAIHPGDSVVAIGYPFHGLLTSDFTVTTGVVSSHSGILNDTRFLQISAAV